MYKLLANDDKFIAQDMLPSTKTIYWCDREGKYFAIKAYGWGIGSDPPKRGRLQEVSV